MSTISTPQLPQELWGRILSFNDKTHLWMTCRQVSRAWRKDTEHIFAITIIKDVHVDFDCDRIRYKDRKYMLAMDMRFSRFSEDKSLAFFKDFRRPKSIQKRPARVNDIELRRWINGINRYLGGDGPDSSERGNGRFDLPAHIITLSGEVNDTELPKLEYYKDEREISFEWRKMLQCFFRELELKEEMSSKWVKNLETKRKAETAMTSQKPSKRAKTSQTQPDGEAVVTQASAEEIMRIITSFVTNQANARATIRRKRIQQYYKDRKYDFDYEPDEDEQDSLQKLKDAEQAAGFDLGDDEEDQIETSASEDEDDEDGEEAEASSGDSDDGDDDSDW